MQELLTQFSTPEVQGTLTVLSLGLRWTFAISVVVLCWRLSRLQFANNVTWRLKTAGYGAVAINWGIAFILRDEVIKIYTGYGLFVVWFTQLLMLFFIVSVFIAYTRIYLSARKLRRATDVENKK